ncbi:PaaI family thioesterase [Agrobacterium larrymoorei]|nr:PaaI family thioesterase [Agrobacterium larrymoorei]
MARILPFELLAPELGKVMLVATPEPSFANTLQTVHGGWAMTMLDTSMNLAAHTTLKGRELAPTLETSVKFVRPISVDAGPLHVSGTVISRTRTVITLEGSITSREGKLFAHGTSTCMVVQA